MDKLKVQVFIENHPDWERLLQEKPYCLSVSRAVWNGRRLMMLKYNQVESDFNEAVVRECRGIVFDEDTMDPVSFPFYKFGNVSEGAYVDVIDWKAHPYVLEKVDGSLIKVSKLDGKLLISTNGTILASEANIPEFIGFEPKTFLDLFYWTLGKMFPEFSDGWFEGLFEEGYTYMFELCTNYNRVVVPYPDPTVYFIGVRNNRTFAESYIMDHPLSKTFPVPKAYEFGSFDECIATAKALPWDSEGYVVTSRDFKRNKVKSLAYLSCHHLCNNHVMSYRRAVELVRLNEVDEVLTYFPEFEKALLDVKEKYWSAVSAAKSACAAMKDFVSENGWTDADIAPSGPRRKDIAVWIQKNFPIPGLAFSLIGGKTPSVEAWLERVPADKVAQMLGYRTKEG